MMERKIALVGTSCTGKTTIFEALRAQFSQTPNVIFASEAARDYFTTHPEIPEAERFSAHHQSAIQEMVFTREQETLTAHPSILVEDRSPWDAAVYVWTTGDHEGARALIDRAKQWTEIGTTILLLDPVGVPYTPDPVRREDAAMRQHLHEEFLALFAREGVVFELVNGPLHQRIQRVSEVIYENLQ